MIPMLLSLYVSHCFSIAAFSILFMHRWLVQEFSGVQGSWAFSENESTGRLQQQRLERFYL
jgi:hypothetical protein